MRGQLATRPLVRDPAGSDGNVDHIPRHRSHQHTQRHLIRTDHHTRVHGRRSKHPRQPQSRRHAGYQAHHHDQLKLRGIELRHVLGITRALFPVPEPELPALPVNADYMSEQAEKRRRRRGSHRGGRPQPRPPPSRSTPRSRPSTPTRSRSSGRRCWTSSRIPTIRTSRATRSA